MSRMLQMLARTQTAIPTSGGEPLAPPVQAKMEQSFRHDFSTVRIHHGRTAADLGALAFTSGRDIHFAPGQYDPHGTGGQELLGHELAHVVQQSGGRVQPTVQGKGMAINDDASLEREADDAGARAAHGEAAGIPSGGSTSSTVVQGVFTIDGEIATLGDIIQNLDVMSVVTTTTDKQLWEEFWAHVDEWNEAPVELSDWLREWPENEREKGEEKQKGSEKETGEEKEEKKDNWKEQKRGDEKQNGEKKEKQKEEEKEKEEEKGEEERKETGKEKEVWDDIDLYDDSDDGREEMNEGSSLLGKHVPSYGPRRSSRPNYTEDVAATGQLGTAPAVLEAPEVMSGLLEATVSNGTNGWRAVGSLSDSAHLEDVAAIVNTMGDLGISGLRLFELPGLIQNIASDESDASELQHAWNQLQTAAVDLGRSCIGVSMRVTELLGRAPDLVAEGAAAQLASASEYLGGVLNALLLVRAALASESARQRANRLDALGPLGSPDIDDIRTRAAAWAKSKHWRQATAAAMCSLAVGGAAVSIAATAGIVTSPVATVGAVASGVGALGSLSLGICKLSRYVYKCCIAEDDHARRSNMANLLLEALENRDGRHNDAVAIVGAFGLAPDQLVQGGHRLAAAEALILPNLQSW